MASLQIRDMTAPDERFVASCTHVGETEEWDASCQRRIPWLREMREQGMRIADDPTVRARYGIYRAIYIDGREVGWGYGAPRDGLRQALREAIER